MEDMALCLRLFMTALTLLCEHQEVASLRIAPNRLQFFEYDSVTFYCSGRSDCKVNRWVSDKMEESACNIKYMYRVDSGEYWCDDEAGKRLNSINITVTAGSVILESPALPVTVGDDVTLRCRNKTSSSNLTAAFYKDGELMRSSSTGEMVLHNVSMSSQGLYKCKVSAVGESPQSWLAVRVRGSSSSSKAWIVIIFILAVLLSWVGLHYFRKDDWDRAVLLLSTLWPRSSSAEDQTISALCFFGLCRDQCCRCRASIYCCNNQQEEDRSLIRKYQRSCRRACHVLYSHEGKTEVNAAFNDLFTNICAASDQKGTNI